MKYQHVIAAVFLTLVSAASAFAQDASAPSIVQQQPVGDTVQTNGPTTFSGTIADTGGAGVENVFFLIRNLENNNWVDVDGSVDNQLTFRNTQLVLTNANTGTWSISTSLPEGSFRLYVSARDNDGNTAWWRVRTTINSTRSVNNAPPDIEDNSLPTASLIQPSVNSISTQQFRGSANDVGGAGLRNVFYLILNTATGDFVSPDGTTEDSGLIRSATLTLSDDNNGTWQFSTSLPNGQFSFFVSVSDNNNNINYWVVRETFDITNGDNPDPQPEPEPEPDPGPEPQPGGSIFVASGSDIIDPANFYQRDGYEIYNVIRMDVATRTNPGICVPGNETGCTLQDVIADTNGDDDFKVDISVKLVTDDLADNGLQVNASLRQRGATSRQAPQKSFRVRLEDDLWRNEERIQLNKHPYDQSRMTNKLAFDLMQRLPHLPSLRTQFVNLWIDDGAGPVNQGLYTHVESRAKEYLINRGLDRDDNMYKANFFTFSPTDLAAIQVDENGQPVDETRFERRIEIDRGNDHTKLVEMVAAINNPDLSFESVLDRYFNRNNVLMWVTANLLLGQGDIIDQNFFLYNPRGTDKFYFLPWDYDGALRVRLPLTNGNSEDELRKRLVYGFANAANNNFLHQYYLLPGTHDRIVRAATEVRRDYFTDDRIRNLSGQYANVIRPFISSSPDIENIGGVRLPERLNVWEERWQSFPSVVAANLEQLSASPNMPLPHRLKLPFPRDGNTVLWWERATDITGGIVTYDIDIASQPDFAPGSIIFSETGIQNQPARVEFELDRLSLPAGNWYYRVRANSGNFYQIGNNFENVGDQRYPGIRSFSVP